jgi:predicted nucleic acid-binding protein
MTEERQPIGYTEPVLMELLAGCRSPREESAIERLLARGRLLSFHSESGFVTAAKVYQQARRNGITPNSFVDCMIITAARDHGATLLTDDANQRRVAQLVDVAVAP